MKPRIGHFFPGFLAFSALLWLSSCAPLPTAPEAAGEKAPSTVTVDKTSTEKTTSVKETKTQKTASDIENMTIGEVIRLEEPNTATLYDNSRYDFPITINARVENWIDYFTGRGRHHMERYLTRSSRYIPVMKDILKKNGLPEDLVYLALIESGFNLKAKSRARAVGPWQFMKATGKRYGLRVDAWIDERRDPLESTVAAGKYLKDLYLMFESWYLAAAAYNAGEYKILRAIEEHKTHNFWRIAQSRSIRRETKEYVPKLIAAAIIAKNPAKYGFEDVSYDEPLEFESVPVNFSLKLKDLASYVDTSEDDLHELNPHLLRGMVPPTEEIYDVRVPLGSRTLVERTLASLKEKGTNLDEMPKEYVVKRGETLRSLANRFRIRLVELANQNNLSPRESVAPGTTLLIPKGGKVREVSRTRPSKRNVSSQEPGGPATGDFITHVVKRGESLWSISEQYSVTVQDIFKWNNLKKSQIFPGKRLRIKSDGSTSTDQSANYAPKKKSKKG